jgi:hypothetical protein
MPIVIPTEAITTVVKGAVTYITDRQKYAAEAVARREQIVADTQARGEEIKARAGSQRQQQAHERWLAQYQAEQERRRSSEDAARKLAGKIHDMRLDSYPVSEGPGFLHDSLGLADMDTRDPVVVVLLAPALAEELSGEAANGLRLRVEDDLKSYAGPLVRTWRVQRPLVWPNRDLYECDLYDVPALILQTSLSHGRFVVRLGGCNLGLYRAEDPRPVYQLTWPRPEDWTQTDIDRLNAAGFSSARVNVRPPLTDDEVMQLNHEMVSRLMTLSVIAAVDAFYLMHRWAYDEMLDGAIRAAGIDSHNWPVDVGVDERFLVDPAYHLLHRAQRYITRKDPVEAERSFILSMSTLAGDSGDPKDVASVVRAAVRAGTIDKHHRAKALRVLGQLREDAEWHPSVRELLEKSDLAAVSRWHR